VPISPPFRVRALLGARAIRSAEHTLDCNDGQGRRRRETGNFKSRRPAYLLHAANVLYMAIFQQSKRVAIA